MGSQLLYLLLTITLAACSRGKSAIPTKNISYSVITSYVLIPGSELTIDLYLMDLISSHNVESESEDNDCVLDLLVSGDDLLWHKSEWKIDVDEEPKSFHRTLRLLVPYGESKIGEIAELKIESQSCFTFSRSVRVPIVAKDLLVTIRTDKPEYQPGEYILIEILVLSQELKPHPQPVNCSIYNSQNEVLVRWLDVTPEEGLLRKEYFVPFLTDEDEWTITLENHEQLVNHTLAIVLPGGPYEKEMFEVDVISPRYVTVYSSEDYASQYLDFSVFASLCSGLPVLGSVKIELSLVGERTSNPLPTYQLEVGHKLISLKLEEVKEILQLKPEESLVGHTVEVHVTVEKNRTHYGKECEVTENEGNESRHEENHWFHGLATSSVAESFNVTFVDQTHVLLFSKFTPLYFKPGMSYVGQILLMPVNRSIQLEVCEVTVIIKQFTEYSGSPVEEKLTLNIESDSIGEFSVKVPRDVIKMELEAVLVEKDSGKNVTAHLGELLPFGSQDEHNIQVTLKNKPPIVYVDEVFNVMIETTFPTELIVYKIFCQSVLVISGNANFTYPTTSNELSIVIPRNVSHLLSSPRLVILARTSCNEIIADSLQFVLGIREEQPLTLELKSETADPGEKVELVVKAEPSTRVYLLTTTERLVFESHEQEMLKFRALEEMERYIHHMNSTEFTNVIEHLCETCFTIPSLAPDSMRVLNESCGLFLSDGELFVNPAQPWPTHSVKNGSLDDIETLDDLPRIGFETRLWQLNVTVGSTGEETIEFSIPEEGKLYTIAAFGLVPGKGLVVSQEPVQLLVTSKLFVELEHPKSIVRGEEFVLDVHLFNNQERRVEVEVHMRNGKEYALLCIEKDSNEEELKIKVILEPKEVKVVPIPIETYPFNQEPIDIRVDVQSDDVTLSLTTTLYTEYQGYEVQRRNSSVLNNFYGNQTQLLYLLADVVNPIKESVRAEVKFYGHPLGPAIEHACTRLDEIPILDDKTKMWFVIGVNVLEHISNNSLFDNCDDGIECYDGKKSFNGSFGVQIDRDECIISIRDAIEFLLEKGNPDGSDSIYPSTTGNIWLTKLILDANLWLKNVRRMNEEKIFKKIEWLLAQQESDGSFIEKEGSILLRHSSPSSHHIPLTSQVVVSLIEALETLEIPETTSAKMETCVERAIDFILEKITSGEVNNDSYSLNVAAYALARAKSESIFEVLLRRNRLIVKEDKIAYWRVDFGDEFEQKSLSIEATAYGVLTYLALNDLCGAGPFVEFLLSRMQPGGKFVFKLDTNIALRALSQYYRQFDIYHDHEKVNIKVNIFMSTWETMSLKIHDPLFIGEMYFDGSNLTLGTPMALESSGEGSVLIQSIVKYNEQNSSSIPSVVDLIAIVHPKDDDHIDLNVCAVNLETEKSNFIIGEVPLLSGYKLKTYDIISGPELQVFVHDGIVYLVFYKVEPSKPQCLQLELERLYPVGVLEPRVVRLYPVNDPDLSVYKSYRVEKSNGLTDIMCHKCLK